MMTGLEIFTRTLQHLGIKHVFGIPGSHDFAIYEELKRSGTKTVLVTHENCAVFMAGGCFRISGKPGVAIVAAGPGFTNCTTALAEAAFDSVGMVCITFKNRRLPGPGGQFQHQYIAEDKMAQTIVKTSYTVDTIVELLEKLADAFNTAQSEEPGPVLLDISTALFTEKGAFAPASMQIAESRVRINVSVMTSVIDRILNSNRPVIYLGQGAIAACEEIDELISLLKVPIFTTSSGRGIVSENHPLNFQCDFVDGIDYSVNDLLDESDLIIALGCKFGHNGSGGFRLNLHERKLVHVDASSLVLNANYPASICIKADVKEFLLGLLAHKSALQKTRFKWDDGELEGHRKSRSRRKGHHVIEPKIVGRRSAKPRVFFEQLRNAMPKMSCLVTDSGLHQVMARRYYNVYNPSQLITPADFQAMGFGIPTAIGVKLANPELLVVALVGDGGFLMSGMELMTAVREGINLIVIVFNDGKLGQIRLQQLSHFGRESAVNLGRIDYCMFAKSLDLNYIKYEQNIGGVINQLKDKQKVSLIEVKLADSLKTDVMRTKGLVRSRLLD